MFRAPSSANNDILGPTDPAIPFYMAVPESPMRLFTIESHYQLLKHAQRAMEQAPPTPLLRRQKTGYSSPMLLMTTG